MLTEVVGEMEYLRVREQKLRDTNESTNTRVKWFGFGTTFLLIGLWGWQIMYLRAYFRCVSLPARLLFLPWASTNTFQLQASYLSSPTTSIERALLGSTTTNVILSGRTGPFLRFAGPNGTSTFFTYFYLIYT